MIVTILTDNTPHDALCGEWGLSIHIQHEGHTILLDTGASSLFAENAEKLGIDLSDVDCGVLSHAHYDHSDGMDAFFARNSKASFYLRRAAQKKCYDLKNGGEKYIGIRDGLLSACSERIVYLDNDISLYDGVSLIGNCTGGSDAQGLHACMYIRSDGGWVPDTFDHEQCLVIETDLGLVVFSSCSHAGADCILKVIRRKYPHRRLRALIGGLHLFIKTEEEVRVLAKELRDLGVEKIITGHCTGEEAISILQDELGDVVETMYCGKQILLS